VARPSSCAWTIAALSAPPAIALAASPAPEVYRWDVQQSGVQGRLWDVCFVDSKTGWAVGEQNTILRTTDGGDSWQPATPIRGTSFGTGAPLGTSWFLVDTIGLWHTDDQGQSWQKNGSVPRNDYTSIAVIDDKQIVIGGDHGRLASTSDGGATWSQRTVPGDAAVEAIQFVTPQLGWITRRYAAPLATVDGGSTWTSELVPISSATPITHLQMLDRQNGYLTTNYDVFHTANGGKSWSSMHHPPGTLLHSVYFPVADEGWTVGEHGYIAHYHRVR
jgi:photosystem II stability/assembly factor-like uncharacterized protein